MFIGHYALGLASKRASDPPSLAMTFLAVEFLDLIWPIFVLLGYESFQIEEGITKITPIDFSNYPYSHSLLMALIWSMLFGVVYFMATKNRKNAWLLGGLVLSHWILDFIVHRPDLPLTPFGKTKVGLGMWDFPFPVIILEIGLFILGVYLYLSARDHKRKIVFWSLIGFLMIIHVMNLLGPAPPNEGAVTWSANLMWIFVIWAWWAEKISDRKRNENYTHESNSDDL